MPIVNYQGSRQVIFGTGDILVSPGLLDIDEIVGVVCFSGNGTGVIGDRTEHHPATILDAEDTPIRLTFEKTESIDVVIRMLEEAKSLMIAKTTNADRQAIGD